MPSLKVLTDLSVNPFLAGMVWSCLNVMGPIHLLEVFELITEKHCWQSSSPNVTF